MATNTLLNLDGTPMIAPKRQSGSGVPMPRAEFMRGSYGGGTAWRPALRHIDDDVGQGWQAAAARSTDLVQNNGWVSGMFDQAVANTVGSGLRLRCSPENDLFGMDEASAQAWRNDVDRRWTLWSNTAVDCDIEGRRTIAQMQEAAFRSWLTTGEILSEIVWRRRYGSRHGTKVRMLSSARMAMKNDPMQRIINGVKLDSDGMPIGYVTKRRDPIMGDMETIVRARDRFGRPKVIHVFVGMPEQVRGITPLVPAMKVAKQFDQLADSTLMAALIQTVFAANLQSDMPTEEALQGMLTPGEFARLAADGVTPMEAWAEMQSGWYDTNVVDIGIGGRIAHTFPGQKLEFLSPTQPATAYREFSLHLLRELARCLGLTYESATGDYTSATYSSVRMAVNEIYQITQARRKFVVAPFLQPIYEAWLEEEIFEGRIGFPGGYEAFLVNRNAACRAQWLGAPKPVADDLKAAKAHQVYRDMGVTTDEAIAADIGMDIEDVYAQRAREKAMREAYGLPDMVGGQIVDDVEDDADGDDTPGA